MEIILKLTAKEGRDLIMHNGRLANPLDPYTQAIKRISGKKNKTDEDLIELMLLEARGGAYETTDGYLGYPTANVFSCIFTAAKAFKLGKRVKQALSFVPTVEPLYVNGAQVGVDGFAKDAKNIDYRLVVVQNKRLMRARLIIPNWQATFRFELNEGVMDARELVPVLQQAGDLIGLGDYRPIYGTFTVEVL